MNNLIAIIVLVIVLVLTLSLVTFLIYLFQKHRKSVLNSFIRDVNRSYKKTHLEALNIKELPVSIEDIKEDIYFCNKAVLGSYQNPGKVINEKNVNVSHLIENHKIAIFYHYKIVNLGSSKFLPLNKIDLVLTKSHLYLYHPLEPEALLAKKIKDVTVFWEKNPLQSKKDFFPGVGFKYQKQNYFLLFQTYKEVVKFLTYLNLVA